MLYEVSFMDGNSLQFKTVSIIASNKQEAWDKVRVLYGDNFEHRLNSVKVISKDDNVHEIWFKDTMPDGTKIQLELWPKIDGTKEKQIGVYPICVRSNSAWIKENETFRLTLCRIPENKAYELYHELRKGLKGLSDCKEFFYYGEKDAESIGLEA
jgi:hypothetical protein